MAEEKLDHIAELEKRLYARDPDSVPKRTFGILHPLKSKVDSSWGEKELPEKERPKITKVSGYKRFFVVSFIFFLIALAGALFSVYKGAITLSSKNVDMVILGNSFVSGGESLPIQVDISNKNSADLVEAELTIAYPRGSFDGDKSQIERKKVSIGTIGSGKTKTQSFDVVLYGEQGSSRTLVATLEYKLSGSNSVFVKESNFSVMINSSPIALSVDAPSSIVSNQPFTMTIRTVFSGETLLDDALVFVEYPNGYVFDSANPSPVGGTSTWALGDLVKGTERVISIKGRLIGEEQDEKAFHVYVGSKSKNTDNKIGVSFNSALHSIVIEQPFISASINVGNSTSDIVALPMGSEIRGYISFANNASIDVASPVFSLEILGDSVDINSISSDGGFYDPLTKTLTWDSNSSRNLGVIAPSGVGRLDFYFKTKSVQSLSDVILSLSVKGTFPDRDFLENSISNIDQKTIRFASRLQFASQALYSIGPIKNTGPYPSKVGQETSYTVAWTIKPSENPITGAVARALLPLGVTWAGVIYPQNESISFNPDSRVISWNIGGVQKSPNTSISRVVYFQVKVKPQKSHIDNPLVLLGETSVSATDTVANTTITTTRPELTNTLSTDPIYSAGKEKVLP